MVIEKTPETLDKIKNIINNIIIGKYILYNDNLSFNLNKVINNIYLNCYYKLDKNTYNNTYKNTDRNKLLKNIQQILIDLKKNKNIIFDKLLSGFDERFIFDFNITNDGKILNYNYLEIKDRLQELLDNKIIRLLIKMNMSY